MPGWFLGPISLIATLLASGEAVALARASGLKPLAPLVHIGNLAIVASAWLPCGRSARCSLAGGILHRVIRLHALAWPRFRP